MEVLRSVLKDSGLKVTPVRLEVLEFLVNSERPVSHAEVQSALPDLDRVTIYRTLSSFVESDIAHQVQGLDGMWRFCAHMQYAREEGRCPGNHPHFLCTSCGRMTCLLDQFMPTVDVPDGCSVDGKQFVVYGRCKKCETSLEGDERSRKR